MSTYMAKAETISRKWYVIDAAGKPLGKTAAAAATILAGKHRPEYTPHVDDDDELTAINVGGELRSVLAAKNVCGGYCGTAEGLTGSVNDIPFTRNGFGFCHKSRHCKFLHFLVFGDARQMSRKITER